MRYLTLLAGLTLAVLPGDTNAQPLGNYSRGFAVNPYTSAYGGYSSFASPYGYRTFSNYSVAPGPLGYNTGTFVRPYVNAPFHSVYFDPFANTYRYGPGYRNTPTYSFYTFSVNPYAVSPYVVNPYALSPYAVNPYVYP